MDIKNNSKENYVITFLYNHLKSKFFRENKKDYRVERNYYYYKKLEGELEGERIVIDVAVLDSEYRLMEVYETCTFLAYERNSNAMVQQLRMLSIKTECPKTYLAFLDDKDKLTVLSLNEIISKRVTQELDITPVQSFLEYYRAINNLCPLNAWDLCYFFRGHTNWEYEAIPSIYRKQTIQKNILRAEYQLYHEAVRQLPLEYTSDMSPFDKLVKMQHFGLPTRLLDITTNPLVALFFACHSKNPQDYNTDGEVLVYSLIKEQLCYYDSKHVDTIANLAESSESEEMKANLNLYQCSNVGKLHPNSFSYRIELLYKFNKVLCVLPKLNNKRLVNQAGAFFIFGIGEKKDEPAHLPDLPYKIRIKAEAKMGILKELEMMNITEASLFPETDKIMSQIRTRILEEMNSINKD